MLHGLRHDAEDYPAQKLHMAHEHELLRGSLYEEREEKVLRYALVVTWPNSRHLGQGTLGDQLLRTGFLTRSIRNECENAFGSAVYGLRQGLVLMSACVY